MRRSRRSRFERPKAAVDMNSLIDLTFLLLVVFIVTLPALEQSVPIILPRAQSKTKQEEHKIEAITLDVSNRIFVNDNDKPLSKEDLESLVKMLVEKDPDIGISFRGDERITYGQAMEIIGMLQKNKVHRLNLATTDRGPDSEDVKDKKKSK